MLTLSQLACVHCQSAGVCSLSDCWRVFIVSQLACVHCQSVRVCSLSVSWRVYTASHLAYVHCQRVFTVSLFACVHCQSVCVFSLSIVTVNLVSCSGEGSPSDGQSIPTAPSLSVLCRYGQHWIWYEGERLTFRGSVSPDNTLPVC